MNYVVINSRDAWYTMVEDLAEGMMRVYHAKFHEIASSSLLEFLSLKAATWPDISCMVMSPEST